MSVHATKFSLTLLLPADPECAQNKRQDTNSHLQDARIQGSQLFPRLKHEASCMSEMEAALEAGRLDHTLVAEPCLDGMCDSDTEKILLGMT